MKLYSVITIVPGWPSRESQQYGGIRTVAICTELERAKQIIETNEFDIFETTYRYALIVEFEANRLYGGVGCINDESYHWYNWVGDYESGKYVPGTRPEEYKQVRFSF